MRDALPSVAANEQFSGILVNLEMRFLDNLISEFDAGKTDHAFLLQMVAKISSVRAMQRQLNSEMNKSIAKANKEIKGAENA